LRGQSKEKRVLLESLKKKLFESIEKDKDKKNKVYEKQELHS
jgi:hypothetical protein